MRVKRDVRPLELHSMTTITLIGTRLAEEGAEFVYQGEAPGCSGCPYREQCLNLESGVRYRITAVRENAQVLDCAMHDEGVRAVEVEKAPVLANVLDQQAFSGSKTTIPGQCPHTSCPSHEYCVPEGISDDMEYRIQEIIGDPPHDYCILERDLTLVKLRQPER